ncbi:unnamed protein product [Cyclocybe aegerita]|uniref:HNH nuclease domain-containing protein n=1 Tax=Cyclocybe aegerita TaxID=1973307 RepID=A0A8S0XST2_CYCAE|nr:unnamed protein product [Cyclocybe aegerita]
MSTKTKVSHVSSLDTTSTERHIYTHIEEDIQNLALQGDLATHIEDTKILINKLRDAGESNIFKHSGAKPEQKLHLILLAMLEFVPDEHAQKADDSPSQGSEHRKVLIEHLRTVAITWLTNFLFIFKASSKAYASQSESISHTPSDITTPTMESTENVGPITTLCRDNLTCVITGARDREHPVPGLVSLQACQILKRAAAKYTSKTTESKLESVIGTFDILPKFTRLPDRFITQPKDWVGHPSNLISLMSITHDLFDHFDICFEKTDDGNHRYKIEYFGREDVASLLAFQQAVGGRGRDDLVVLTNNSPNRSHSNDKMPDLMLFKIHAAIAGILHMSGAGKFCDELLQRYPPTGSSAPAVTWLEMERQIYMILLLGCGRCEYR